MATKTNETVNIIVQRRLAFFPNGGAKAAQDYMNGKATVEELAEKFNVSTIQALYAVRQHAVEAGLVQKLNLDANDQKSVVAAHGKGDHADWAWLACRSGVTPQRLQITAKGDAPTPQSAAANQRGGKGKQPSTRSRRSAKKEPATA